MSGEFECERMQFEKVSANVDVEKRERKSEGTNIESEKQQPLQIHTFIFFFI